MDSSHLEVVQDLYPKILEWLEPKDLLPFLLAEGLLDNADMEKIENEKDRRHRVVELVELLRCKLRNLNSFVMILRLTKYITLAEEFQHKLNDKSKLNEIHGISNNKIPEFQMILQDFYKGFSTIHLIPGNPRSVMQMEDMWVNLKIAETPHSTPEETYKICIEEATSQRIPIVIQGEPGGGKTTLVKKMCLDWASGSEGSFTNLNCVLMARLKDVKKAQTLLEICQQWVSNNCADLHDTKNRQDFEGLLRSVDPRSVLLILDGLDESIVQCPELDDLFKPGFKQCKYPVIITTRPYKAFDILSDIKLYYIQQLTHTQQVEYIQKHFQSHLFRKFPIQTAKEMFLETLNFNTQLQETLGTPLLLQLSLISGHLTKCTRQTDIYKELLSVLLKQYETKHEKIEDIDADSWMFSEAVFQLGSLAYQKLVTGEDGILYFTEGEMMKFHVPEFFVKTGILTVEENWLDIQDGYPVKVFSFLHKTVQEFFAALALTISINKMQSEMSELSSRINSFKTWPKQSHPTPKEFAKAGFFYTGAGDVVQCPFCFASHSRFFSALDHMRFVLMHFDHCKYNQTKLNRSLFITRLESFDSWPKSDIVHPRDLAVAGFYFTEVSDNVQCYCCGININKWESGDDPMTEHRKYRQNCPYLELIDGKVYEKSQNALTGIGDNSLEEKEPSGAFDSSFASSSLFQQFYSIWNKSSKFKASDYWMSAKLLQTSTFLAGITSDINKADWIVQSIKNSRYVFKVFKEIKKLFVECPTLDLDKCLEHWDKDFIFQWLSPHLLSNSKTGSQIYPGMWKYGFLKGGLLTTEIKNSYFNCILDLSRFDREQLCAVKEEIVNSKPKSPSGAYSVVGSLAQVKHFCSEFSAELDCLRIQLSRISAKFEVLSFLSTLPRLRRLIVDISEVGWLEELSNLIYSAPNVRQLWLLGSGHEIPIKSLSLPLSLCHLRLRDINLLGAKLLSTSLAKMLKLQFLEISNCQLNAVGFVQIVTALTTPPNFRYLSLSMNMALGKDPVLFTKGCTILAEFQCLSGAAIDFCGLTDMSIPALLSVIKKSCSIQSLSLRDYTQIMNSL